MGFGQFAATSQFFLYGRKHFTRTGWEKHKKSYEQPDIMTQDLDLAEKVFIITGANSGVGKEVAQFLASKSASVYMVCRSRKRAEAAQAEIVAATSNSKVYILEADVGLEADVRRCWSEFAAQSVRLDGLVCNAGALMNEKTLTSEGLEVTFASHLLFGTYLLGSLALPTLKTTPDSRLMVVSSGGMYNFPFPAWDVATSTSLSVGVKYDGQSAYAYAKRGQVLLCERWAAEHPEVKVVSCHPGWTGTPAVDAAYGDQKSYLEPMRTPWEGAEGIAWLCVAPAAKIETAAFYLDRKPQVKHIAGPFFTEGSYTKNTTEQVDDMMRNMDDWANGRRPADLRERAEDQASGVQARIAPLVAMERPIELERFMGRWYVHANIPTYFDRGTVNNTEDYTLDETKKTVHVSFCYCDKELTKTSKLLQRAAVKNDASTEWAISPKIGLYLPVAIPYLIVDCAEDYSSSIVGVPDRAYVWIMTRSVEADPAVVDDLIRKAQLMGYDVSKVVKVPQKWENGEPPCAEAPEQESSSGYPCS